MGLRPLVCFAKCRYDTTVPGSIIRRERRKDKPGRPRRKAGKVWGGRPRTHTPTDALPHTKEPRRGVQELAQSAQSFSQTPYGVGQKK